MRSRWSIRNLPPLLAPVKSPGAPADVPVAVRPVSGLPPARIPRVKRSRTAAYASAFAAVFAHTPEVEFLRARLAAYQATTPRDLNAPIPSMEVTEAGVFVIHDTDRRHPIDLMLDPDAGAAPQAPAVAAEVTFQEAAFEAAGEAIARRAAEVEEDVQTVDRELREANDELALLGAEGTTAADARRHAIESGRIDLAPARFPTRTRILLWRGWIAFTLVGEWVAFFFALANSIGGIDPAALEAEWAAGSAWAITGAAVVAATVVGATFILAEWAGAQLHSARAADGASPRNVLLWTASFGAGIVASVLVVVAVMRAQLTGEPTDLAALLRYAILTAAPLIAAVVPMATCATLRTAAPRHALARPISTTLHRSFAKRRSDDGSRSANDSAPSEAIS